MMMQWIKAGCVAGFVLSAPPAVGAFTVTLDSADFATTSVFNDVASFSFELVIDAPLVAGGVYSELSVTSVDYTVFGVLTEDTPSMFPQFNLTRTMTGAEFAGLSPESGLSFAIDAGADLSDGLQLSELAGAGTVFDLNLREFNQTPGRYHPPIFTLDSDGTGRLVNADNKSDSPNPPPPMGSGLFVDVAVGDEYDVALTFDASAVAIAVPEPTSLALLGVGGLLLSRRRSGS